MGMRMSDRARAITLLAAILFAGILASGRPAFCATEEGRYLTRSDAARLLSATDFLKNKIGQLLSWSIGYDISALNRAKLVPTIRYIEAMPIKMPPDGRTILSLLVAVDDPSGLSDISGVRADLSNIGQLPNMALVDNGLWGDLRPGDGVYTIQTSVKSDVAKGEKEIQVAVANKKGWVTVSRTTLNVDKNPTIISARATPGSVSSDGRSKTLLTVVFDNPGRPEDVKRALVDLSSIGGEEVAMHNDGMSGDAKAGDNTFSLEIAIPSGLPSGEKSLPVKISNAIGGQAYSEIIINIK